MKKDFYSYNWKTYQLVIFSWGPWFFGAIFVTLFYYGFVFALSNWLFNGINFYLQGILAGLAGGIWGYAINRGYKRQNEIELKIDKFSDKKYKILLRESFNRTILFFGLIFIEILIIYIMKLY